MLLDLRILLKELEKTQASSWGALLGDLEAVMNRHLDKVPVGYEAADLLDVMESLRMLSYDVGRGVFLVRVLTGREHRDEAV